MSAAGTTPCARRPPHSADPTDPPRIDPHDRPSLPPRLRGARPLLTTLRGGRPGRRSRPAGEDAYVSPSQARLKADVAFLAADAQEGRGPGTKGIEAAADHIAAAFAAAGLKPAPGAEEFFQPFTIRGDARVTGEPTLTFQGPNGRADQADDQEFAPLAIGSRRQA